MVLQKFQLVYVLVKKAVFNVVMQIGHNDVAVRCVLALT